MRLQQRDRADQRRLERRPELVPVAQHALGDRDRVGGVALARPLVHPLPLDAPGRDVQDLLTGVRLSTSTRTRARTRLRVEQGLEVPDFLSEERGGLADEEPPY